MPTKKELIKNLKKSGYKAKDLKKLKKYELEDLTISSHFGDQLAPNYYSPGNLEIQGLNPFADIYVGNNLSGYPWYKNQNPTLPINPRSAFGSGVLPQFNKDGLNKTNYTISQYATNVGTPTLNQLHNISGDAAYNYPIGGYSSNGYNFKHYASKSKNSGMGF